MGVKKILSFGELLLRICPDGEGEWLAENRLPFYVGGAEANVATALALWGLSSAYVTALPENFFSRQLSGYLAARGIDVSRVLYQGNRVGLYYLPKGKDLKNAGVIYDRAYSSFSELAPGTIDWDTILTEDIGWLHFSAISPALNRAAAAVCEELLQAAVAKGIRISVDLNYRAKLWQYGASPLEIMPGLVKYCDLVMGNLWAAEKMLGIAVDAGMGAESSKEACLDHARRTSESILTAFPTVKLVANTFRFSEGETGIRYSTTLYTEGQLYDSREYRAAKIIDQVGSGDCFMAGLIYGLSRSKGARETLEFATAAAFQKLFIPSDATNQPASEIEKFMTSYEG